jgi:predicted nucleic acid-binding protein
VIVLDASAVMELVLNTAAGRRVAREIAPPQISLNAPHIIDVEVTQALRRYVRSRMISAERGSLALKHLSQLDLTRYDHVDLLPRIWALRDNLTAYDAAYVALAEALEARLLTLDVRLAAAPGHRARICLLD